MLQVAVCAGEAALREQLKGLILRTQEGGGRVAADMRGPLSGGEQFDILFLEIEEGMRDQIGIAAEIRQDMDTLVIFISSGQDYVFDAFNVQAFHYLLKPVDEERFADVLCRAVHEKMTQKEKEPLLIRAKGSFYRVEKKNIFYVENVARKVVLHMKGGELAYYARMKEVEEELGSCFFRCHRGYLVNLGAVRSYGMGSILLKNGETILMAKQKYSEFAAAYAGFLHADYRHTGSHYAENQHDGFQREQILESGEWV